MKKRYLKSVKIGSYKVVMKADNFCFYIILYKNGKIIKVSETPYVGDNERIFDDFVKQAKKGV